MSVQDEITGQEDDREPTDKPEPDEGAKKRAADMMAAYDGDRPTVVLPGSGGSISGTAINEWLDEDGNPKFDNDVPSEFDEGSDAGAKREQIEKDKALNVELIKAAHEANKGENR